jgi:hypothetical protein
MVMTRTQGRVDLPGGPVTLEGLEQLSARRDFLVAQIKHAATHLQQMSSDVNQKGREAGAILLATRALWDTSAVRQQLSTIDAVTARIDQTATRIARLDERRRHGLGGLLERFADRRERAASRAERRRQDAELTACLQVLSRQAPETTVPDADRLLEMLRNVRNRCSGVRQQQTANEAELSQLDDEIRRRREAISKLGFDAPWTAAWLQSNEPAAIDSPVQLKSGEIAWLSAPATLSRPTAQTHWTGSSRGVSFPIGHTGIRYRVGSFRGHPIQSTVIQNVDSGDLVLTNGRLVFVGRLHSVVIPLGDVVHVEAYTDALGVFQDNRQTPDFFKVTTPQHVLFYLNYALNRLG